MQVQERIIEASLHELTRQSLVAACASSLVEAILSSSIAKVQVPKVCTVEKVVEVPQVQIQEAWLQTVLRVPTEFPLHLAMEIQVKQILLALFRSFEQCLAWRPAPNRDSRGGIRRRDRCSNPFS